MECGRWSVEWGVHRVLSVCVFECCGVLWSESGEFGEFGEFEFFVERVERGE